MNLEHKGEVACDVCRGRRKIHAWAAEPIKPNSTVPQEQSRADIGEVQPQGWLSAALG